MATTKELRDIAATNQGLAKQALGRLQELADELAGRIVNLTDPDALKGEGNLGWYKHEMDATLLQLRQTFAGLEGWQDDLDEHLARVGVRAVRR